MITLTILSPGGTLCSAQVEKVSFPGAKQVEKVSFPGAKGLFTVYPEHAPLLSSLLPGTIEWTAADGSTGSVAVRAGCVRVHDDNVEACVEVLNGGGGKA